MAACDPPKPFSWSAQPAKRVYRIAILDDAVETARAERWKQFRNRLRELGQVEGKDFVYEVRYARGANERLPALAAELVALKPDVIITPSTPPTIAAIRLAYLTDVANTASVAAFRQVEGHARAMNVTIRMLDARQRIELERSFETIKRERLQGFIVGTTGVLIEHRDQIVQFAAKEKLPAVYGVRENVIVGGLLSYSVDFQFAYLRGADYVHRILLGARPADLPVEQSSNMRMALNLKTARALGGADRRPHRVRRHARGLGCAARACQGPAPGPDR